MPPVADEMTTTINRASDAFADADGLPIGESDSYLISMVSSIETEVLKQPRRSAKAKTGPSGPLGRRALLLNGKD